MTSHGFTTAKFAAKLAKMSGSQNDIVSLSRWMIFYQAKARDIVEAWALAFFAAPERSKLTFIYLINDVLQNSRRKHGAVFTRYFEADDKLLLRVVVVVVRVVPDVVLLELRVVVLLDPAGRVRGVRSTPDRLSARGAVLVLPPPLRECSSEWLWLAPPPRPSPPPVRPDIPDRPSGRRGRT